ncbi:MAG: hypothetical protein WD065_04235 [Planctomycetaceae bacterium]
MSLVRTRSLAATLFAVYGFCAVVGPAGLHNLIPHEHHAPVEVAYADHAHDHGHHHDHHDHEHHARHHHSHEGRHSHLPGESEQCLVCQFMATAAQPTVPPAVELTAEFVAELTPPALPSRHRAATSSISIRGPPAKRPRPV